MGGAMSFNNYAMLIPPHLFFITMSLRKKFQKKQGHRDYVVPVSMSLCI